jgi:hypothetical protein
MADERRMVDVFSLTAAAWECAQLLGNRLWHKRHITDDASKKICSLGSRINAHLPAWQRA